MTEPNGMRVRAEIVEIMGGGACASGLEVGRAWIIEDSTCPQGMCSWAYNSIMPFITVLRCNGRFPWKDEPLARVCCPDADNPVVFILRPEPSPKAPAE